MNLEKTLPKCDNIETVFMVLEVLPNSPIETGNYRRK